MIKRDSENLRFLFYAAAITSWLINPITVASADPGDDGNTPADLTKMGLEELMDLEVTSVFRKPQKVSEAAAAVTVITHEEIRRSGATSLPEVLRMVPGINVARITSNQWAVSIRGFNSRFANKLLVMLDGRILYNHMIGGVFWEPQDTVLEDIERIEVIRGPGGTLWGENAVNGIINVITKDAKDTQGVLASAGVGSEERGFGTLRYGGKIGDDLHYRVYGKYFDRDTGFNNDGAHDDWRFGRAGFRTDWDVTGRDAITVQGDYYDGTVGEAAVVSGGEPMPRDREHSGSNVLFRWDRSLSQDSDLGLLMYYDYFKRDGIVGEDRHTLDLDFQHRFPLYQRQDLLWGMEYRFTSDRLTSLSDTIVFAPEERDLQFFSGFVQDEIELLPDRLSLTIGSKFSHNDLTGFEVQPNARMAWTPASNQTIWGAVSRAVRIPSRREEDSFDPTEPLFQVMPVDRQAEKLVAYELGYRTQPHDTISLDLTAFYNDYDTLISILSPTGTELFDGESYGVEVAANWQPFDRWRLYTAYTFLDMDVAPEFDGANPEHQFSIQSLVELAENVEFDSWLRFVDDLPALDVSSYVTLDLRLGWRPIEDLELSLVGQNLLDHRHPEFTRENRSSGGLQSTEVERAFYVKATWGF